MITWGELAQIQPDMAAFGLQRIGLGVMYLATLRADGYPRVHPITPFVGSGHLFTFMEATSPKAKDLQRDPRYAMHSLVTDSDGSNGEFQVSGRAQLCPELREVARQACPYSPKDRYIVFEFRLERCFANEYDAEGNPNPRRWREQGP